MFKYIYTFIILFSVLLMSPVDISDAEVLVDRFIDSKDLSEPFEIISIDNQSNENLFIMQLSPITTSLPTQAPIII